MQIMRASYLLALLLAATPQVAAQSQFSVFITTPCPPSGTFQNCKPYNFDNVSGEWINYETQLIKPIIVISGSLLSSTRVIVANEPNGTVEVFDGYLVPVPDADGRPVSIHVGQGITALEYRAGANEVWVSARHQQGIAVISTVAGSGTNPPPAWRITHWLRAPITVSGVGYGAADMPGQIVFASGKAYVSSFNNDAVVVFDASTKQYLQTVALTGTHNGMQSALNTPYSMALVGSNRIYVVSHLSGNQTTGSAQGTVPDPSVPPGEPAQPRPQKGVRILDLSTISGRSLPDFDIMAIDTTTDQVVSTETKRGVGSVNFNVLYHSGKVFVTNLLHRNGEFVGEESWKDGRVARNRLTVLDPADTSSSKYTFLDLDEVAAGFPISYPTDIIAGVYKLSSLPSPVQRFFVAGFGSARLGVFEWNASQSQVVYKGRIEMPARSAPRGLAYHIKTLSNGNESYSYLYVYSRGDNYVYRYLVTGGSIPSSPTGNVAKLTDPTYDDVKAGRKILVDSNNSGFKSTSCISCHVDGRKEGLAWDLSKHHDPVPTTSPNGFSYEGALPAYWRDRKGIMVTQDLRSIEETAPYHWRGEQFDLEDFNPAFEGLLHGTRLTDADFRLFKKAVFSMRYPPNPFQKLDRNYSAAALSDFTGAIQGQDGDPATAFARCTNCHEMPLGTKSAVGEPLFNPEMLAVGVTPSWRGLWTKESALCDSDDALGNQILKVMTGFGLEFQGDANNIPGFRNATKPTMLKEFDSGLAPATVFSFWFDQSSFAQSSTYTAYLVDQANNKNCDFVGRGYLFNTAASKWEKAGLLWDRRSDRQRFILDTAAPPNPGLSVPFGDIYPSSWLPASQTANTMTLSDLAVEAAAGRAAILLMGVPFRSGERIGVDVDRDGLFDRFEISIAFDPRKADSDDDGIWDTYEYWTPTPSVAIRNVVPQWATTNTIKVTYDTNIPVPTSVSYGVNQMAGDLEKDAQGNWIPLSGSSNRWKKHHTAFLRQLPDGASVLFTINSQIPGGPVVQHGALYGWNTLPDGLGLNPVDNPLNPNIRVTALSLSSTGSAGSRTWTANVTVKTNAGQAVRGVIVRGVFLRFRNINGQDVPQAPAVQKEAIAITDVNGVALVQVQEGVDWPADQSPCDIVRFTIPATIDRDPGSGVTWGQPITWKATAVPAPPGTGDNDENFLWPESITSVEAAVPPCNP